MIKEPLAQSIILLLLFLWILSLLEKRNSFRKPVLLIPLSIFLLSILCSLKNAIHKPLVLEFFFLHFLLASLYCVAAQLKMSGEKEKIVHGIAAASLISALYGIAQYMGFDFIPWATQWDRRPSATFGNPNFAAGWWVMVFPLFSAKFLMEKSGKRWLWFLLSILVLLNLYMGRTRGAWLALIIAMVLSWGIWHFSNKKFSKKINSLLLAIVFLSMAATAFLGYQKLNRSTDPSILERIFKWKTAQEMIREYPVFGVGAGNLKAHFAFYQASVRETMPIPLRATSESNVHNEYLQLWAETGTVGLLSLLSVFLVWFLYFIKNFGALPSEVKIEKLGTASAVFSFIFFSLTNFPLHIVPNAALLYFLLGFRESSKEEKDKTIPARTYSPNIFARFCAAVLFFFVLWKWILPPLQADRYRLKAERAAAEKNYAEAISLYRRAIELDFYHSERTAYDLAETYRAVGQIENALDNYMISVRLRNYGEVYNNIGNCYYLLRDKTEAVRNWEMALKLGIPDVQAQKQTEKNLVLIKKYK